MHIHSRQAVLILALTLAALSPAQAKPRNKADGHPAHAAHASTAVPAAQANDGSVIAQFKAALARAQIEGEPASTDRSDSEALRQYPLYDYVVAARLRFALSHPAARASAHADSALDTRIASFISAHAEQPVARSLRRQWLASLARRAHWETLLAQKLTAAEERDDAELACPRLQAQLALTKTDGRVEGLAEAALQKWSATPTTVTATARYCGPVFDWLRERALLTPVLTETRARNALRANNLALARSLLPGLPDPVATPLQRWAALLESPQTGLNALTAADSPPMEAEALLPVFDRYSHRNATSAQAIYAALAGHSGTPNALGAETLAGLRRSVAIGLALDHDADSIPMFAQLPDSAVDTTAAEWRVRAALWHGQYALARDWIAKMPPELGNQARWRYWRARATDELGDHEGAKALYAAVANERDYYSYLAADRLNLPYQLNFHPTADVPEMQRTLLATPAIQRARAFLDCGMEDEASVEWNYAMRDATPAQQVQAARLASRWQWYPQSITTLAKAGEWNDVRLRYPQPFAEPVAAAVNATGLPPVWIYGVMRQESLYRPDVRSPADALGLLQVLPSGAREIAHDAGLPVPTRAQLFEPATGVLFGALELREKFDGQNHQLARTFAAYNAGPTAVSRWLPPAPMASDIWAENIPYNETRGYVQRVLEHIVAFGWVTDGKPERISPWLGPILPRGSSAAAGAIPDATPSVAQPPATPAMTADPAAPAASTTPGNGQ